MQHLNDGGIDISDVPSDINLGAKYAESGRLAQSPLGSLINAGLKNQSNQIALSGLTGEITPGALAPTVPGLGNALTSGIKKPNIDTAPIDTKEPTKVVSIMPEPPARNVTFPKFSPPAPKSGETRAAYEARVRMAQEAYNSDPAKKEAESLATKTGDVIAETAKTVNIMQSNLPSVLQRFENMRAAAKIAGYGPGNNNEGSGFMQQFHKGFDNSETGNANATLEQFAAQGILPELGPQLAQAGIRGNKFLETLASSASGLDLAASPSAKQKVIDGLENTYISNLKASAAQLRENGQPAPTDSEIDAQIKQYKSRLPADPAISYPNLVPKNDLQIKPLQNPDVSNPLPKKGEVRDGHLFMGGNPNDKNNWKKI